MSSSPKSLNNSPPKRPAPTEPVRSRTKRRKGLNAMTDLEVWDHSDTEILAAIQATWRSKSYEHYTLALERHFDPNGEPARLIIRFECKYHCPDHSPQLRERLRSSDSTQNLLVSAAACDRRRGLLSPQTSPSNHPKPPEYSAAKHRAILSMRCARDHRSFESVVDELLRHILTGLRSWVTTLDIGKSGYERRVAQALKAKWLMSDDEWTVLEQLVQILEPFEDATLSFSQTGRVHLPEVLPTYMKLRRELSRSRDRLIAAYGPNRDPYGLLKAISEGDRKLDKYFTLARKSDLMLISSILHPGMRLNFFQDEDVWGEMMHRGRALLQHLFDTYKDELEQPAHEIDGSNRQQPHTKSQKLSWSDQLLELSASPPSALDDELTRFFGNIYPYERGTNVLKWWMSHEKEFPILSRIARDLLGIPATSVSVERLFSRCKLVMSDYRTMSVETARRIITCQQWLEAGLGVDLPNFVSGDQDSYL